MADLPSKIQLEIVTPSKHVLVEEVDEVSLPGQVGYLGILPGHLPLLTTLGLGEVSYRIGERWHSLVTFWGFAEILPNKVSILAEVAEKSGDIDLDAARAAKGNAEVVLQKEDGDYEVAKIKLEQSIARIDVAGRM